MLNKSMLSFQSFPGNVKQLLWLCFILSVVILFPLFLLLQEVEKCLESTDRSS